MEMHSDGAGRYEMRALETSFTPSSRRDWRFEIVGPSGHPRSYRVQHERDLHLIVVRDDLSTFSHVHPVREEDGWWTIPLELPRPGRYTAFADVAPDDAPATTLRLPLVAEGEWAPSSPPAPARTAAADGYEVELRGDVVVGGSDVEFAVTHGGAPVTPDPYLGAAGHLVAIKTGDLDYLHVHPGEAVEPATIPFMIHAPSAGTYRLFLQFAHGGAVHTVDFTVAAAPAR